ncbi:MAG: cupin-like domain-containing protein [Myxococcales bacterium]|nr:cupin-like domain-containing protein [Myxococcales bacterium]
MEFDTQPWSSRALIALRRLGVGAPTSLEVPFVRSSTELDDALARSRPVCVRLRLADDFDLEDTIDLVPERVPVATGDYQRTYDTPLEHVSYRDYLRFLTGDQEQPCASPSSGLPPYLRAARFAGGFELLQRTPPELGLSERFGPRACEQPLLWAGPQQAASVAHVDIFDNFAIGLRGTKVFRLWHASDLAVEEYRPGDPRGRFWTCHGPLPPPRATVELSPDVGLVLPAGWIHEVRARGTTVMINFFNTRCEPRSFTALRHAAAS